MQQPSRRLRVVPPSLVACACAVTFSSARATEAGQVPRAQLPPPIQAALRAVENQFDLSLGQDCPQEKCFSRGCTYVSHETVDRARGSSLPGLGEAESAPGAQGPSQEYLTGARCEFAYENTFPPKDIATLVKRLEQKLSRGYLTLGVDAKPLPALPASLRAQPTQAAASPVVPTPAASPSAAAGDAQASKSEADDARPDPLRELWKTLLPHFGWMIAILLGTTALLVVIWAFRRLGRQTAEEKAEERALLAGLDENATPDATDATAEQGNTGAPAGTPEGDGRADASGEGVPAKETAASALASGGPSSEALLRSFGRPAVWKSRMAAEPKVFQGVLRRWLREKDYASVAKLALGSQEEFHHVLPSGEEFALERAELADFMAQMDPASLPTDEGFAAILSNAIVASYVSEQDDDPLVSLARLLREQFGPEGYAELVRGADDRTGAVLFAVIPAWRQAETALLLPLEKRMAIAASLAASPRASHLEMARVLGVVNAAVTGGPVPAAEATSKSGAAKVPHGRDLHAGHALSALLPAIPKEARRAFVKAERARFNGATPPWCDGLFYPEMLAALSPDARASLFLQIDARDIAVWSLALVPDLRKRLLSDLPTSLAAAVQSYHASGMKGSATEARTVREKVRAHLAEAVRGEMHGGRLQLEDAV